MPVSLDWAPDRPHKEQLGVTIHRDHEIQGDLWRMHIYGDLHLLSSYHS